MGYQQYTNSSNARSSCRIGNESRTSQPRYGGAYPRFAQSRSIQESAWNRNTMTVAMAYVPIQQWGELYDLDRSLSAGTIFPVLDKPFLERSCCNR